MLYSSSVMGTVAHEEKTPLQDKVTLGKEAAEVNAMSRTREPEVSKVRGLLAVFLLASVLVSGYVALDLVL